MSKPITKEDLGNMLHKYINPLYGRIDKLEGCMDRIEIRMGKFDKRMDGFEARMGTFEGIQLRMENKLDDNIKLFHDRYDAHNKQLKDHEGRISDLENPI